MTTADNATWRATKEDEIARRRGTEQRLSVPTVHVNGTSKDALAKQLADAIDAVHEAGQKLAAACPNGRDYYPQTGDAIGAAMRQHERRMGLLRTMADELERTLVAVDGQAVDAGCKACGGKLYLISSRDDGALAVERCDTCSPNLMDAEAALKAASEGVKVVSFRYPYLCEAAR